MRLHRGVPWVGADDRDHNSEWHFQLSRWSAGQGRGGLGPRCQPGCRWYTINDQAGVVTKFREKIQAANGGHHFWTFHCILHQEALCSKSLRVAHTHTPVEADFVGDAAVKWRPCSLSPSKICDKITGLLREFQQQFQIFGELETEFTVFRSPFTVKFPSVGLDTFYQATPNWQPWTQKFWARLVLLTFVNKLFL